MSAREIQDTCSLSTSNLNVTHSTLTTKSASSPMDALSRRLAAQQAHGIDLNCMQFQALLLNITPTLGQSPLQLNKLPQGRHQALAIMEKRPTGNHIFHLLDDLAGKVCDEERCDNGTRDVNGHITPSNGAHQMILSSDFHVGGPAANQYRASSALSPTTTNEDSFSVFSHGAELETTPLTSPPLNFYSGIFGDNVDACGTITSTSIERKAVPIRKPLRALRRPDELPHLKPHAQRRFKEAVKGNTRPALTPSLPTIKSELKPAPKAAAATSAANVAAPRTKRALELSSGSDVPNKKQALELIHTAPGRIKLEAWKNQLVAVEELVFQGKEAYNEIKLLMPHIRDMARHTNVPASWVKAPVRLREEAGQEIYMNKVQLLEKILNAYQDKHGPLTDHFVRIVEGLCTYWARLARMA
ncbi:SSD domain-containing protein [Mycena chlorophos]|uniref:SSD domain-containing protein n=1 Tax=Mycena chlorophos TaxID=658473 RepID=A0A8H6WCG2_MYCCL|nr:SSD domain-containing protein [Mycena chlorophos]